MDSLPMEWIDKLFYCLELFYGERWSKQFKNSTTKELAKKMWQSGLHGCSYDDIRNVLVYLKRAAKSPFALPPHLMEFYRYAKRKSVPFIDYHDGKIGEGDVFVEKRERNPEVAKRAFESINAVLRYKALGGST